MRPRFRTEPEASAELGEAALWYERQRNGLGSEFLEAIDLALEFIARFPQAGSPVPGVPRDLPVRRAPVRRFPFHVVYLQVSDVIRILAFSRTIVGRPDTGFREPKENRRVPRRFPYYRAGLAVGARIPTQPEVPSHRGHYQSQVTIAFAAGQEQLSLAQWEKEFAEWLDGQPDIPALPDRPSLPLVLPQSEVLRHRGAEDTEKGPLPVLVFLGALGVSVAHIGVVSPQPATHRPRLCYSLRAQIMKFPWGSLFLLFLTLLVSGAAAQARRPAMVVLDTPPVAEFFGRGERARVLSGEGENLRSLLRRGKSGLAAGLAARGAVVTGQTETLVNTLLIEATDEDLAWLRRQPGVKKAEFAEEVHAFLDAALPLVGAPQAWAALGGEDNAGRGMKIAILDSGIEIANAMFSGAGFTAPSGFPKASVASDMAFTNNKVIVARNYTCPSTGCPTSDPDVQDRFGHGTLVAAVAAGRRTQAPLASISGVAPGAYLGSYKVFDAQGRADTNRVIQAMNEAIQDGMDVINFSGGSSTVPSRFETEYVQAIRNAATIGSLVVFAGGNCGPASAGDSSCPTAGDRTISSPGYLPDALTVGASTNARTFSPTVRVTSSAAAVPATLQAVLSVRGTEPNFTGRLGPVNVVDISTFDSTGLGCNPFPAGSVSGGIALIRRGTCNFTDKIANAASAGAVAVIVYNNVSGFIRMLTDGARIPSVLISNTDGETLRDFVAANRGAVQASLDATATPNLVANFSSRGPVPSALAVKPDLVAPGEDIYAATQSINSSGEIFSETGFTVEDGTSFSTPIVTGAVALVRQARPSLTPPQLKSVLVNTATQVTANQDEATPSVTSSGAGQLNLPAALSTALVADPVSISFGSSSSPRAPLNSQKSVTFTNVGASSETFTASVAVRFGDPNLNVTVNPGTFTLSPGGTASVTVTAVHNGQLLRPSYEGFINVRNASRSTNINVPYWIFFDTAEVVSNGVVNGASFKSGAAPGGIVSVFGIALGGREAGAASLPLPKKLGDTAIAINGTDVPLFFSSPAQLNIQLPFTLTTGAVTGTVRLNDVAGSGFSFLVSSAAPGIFTVPSGGTGPGAILHANGSLVTATNPARAGEFLSIFCTGLGAVSTPPAAGAAAPSNPLSMTSEQPTVTIGGVNATVQFSGLAPAFAGLYQINVQVPNGLRAGPLPVVVSIAGAASNTVTVAVN